MARRAPGPCRSSNASGFTLLEVLVAVAILAISLTSLLTSQMNALRATRYAQQVTAAAFLADYQLIEIEWKIKQEENGWGDNDKEYEGDFSEQGWPDITYKCLVDMIEMPDYTALQAAAEDTDGMGNDLVEVQDTGEQAFDALGMVWPMVKSAIEQSIRKASCTVYWTDGPDRPPHEFEVMTFWTDTTKLDQIQQAGGEVGEEDDTNDPDAGGGAGGGAGGPGGGTPGGEGRGGGRGGIGGAGGPFTPPSGRGR